MKKFLLFIAAVIISISGYSQACSDLFISEYLEGSSQNKALEIYNPTDQTIVLDDYKIWRFSNGSASVTNELSIVLNEGPNEIGPYETIVISNGQIEPNTYGNVDTTLYELADMNGPGVYPTPMYFNGNDAIALVKNNEPVDLIGEIGVDPGEGWTNIDSLNYEAGDYYWLSWTSQNRLVRKSSIREGVKQNPDFFDPSTQWDSIGWDTTNIDNNWDHLGFHECDCEGNGIINNKTDKNVNVNMFPNPASQGESIRILANKHIASIQFVNIVGKLIREETLVNNPGNFVTNTNKLNKGIYIIRILFTDKTQKAIRLSVE